MSIRPTVALATADGKPLLCELAIRESESMPSRLKVSLVVDLAEGVAAATPDGLKPMQVDGPPSGGKARVCAEFRLEMN